VCARGGRAKRALLCYERGARWRRGGHRTHGEAGGTDAAGASRTQELNVRDRPDNADGKDDRGRTNRQDYLGEPSNGVQVVSLKLHRVSLAISPDAKALYKSARAKRPPRKGHAT
jgi:hypothetical protein